MGKEKKLETSLEAEKFIDILLPISKYGLVAAVLGIPAALILQNTVTKRFPLGIYVALVLFAVAISVFIYLFKNKVSDMESLRRVGVWYFLVMNLLLTVVVHYLGGIEGIGFFIYSFLVIEAGIILKKRGVILVTLSSVFFYGTLAFLEYFGVIPHHSLFAVGKGYQSLRYLLVHVGGGVLVGLSYSAFITSRFANVYQETGEALEKEREVLIKTQDQLRVARDTLEVRVRARTEALKRLTEDLERQVKERTKELEEKIEELENFQKFAVGREMKMMELKRKIKDLEKKKRG